MAKGNRTRGADRRGNKNPDVTILNKTSADKNEMTEHYRKIAEMQSSVIRYGQEYALMLRDNLESYIIEQRQHKRPVTIAGLIRASGMGQETYQRYRDGKADHLLYVFMDYHGIPYSEENNIVEIKEEDKIKKVLLCRLSTIIKNAELIIQEQLEENCYTNKGNPAGSIFGLKAKYKWYDTPPDTRTTNNNTLVLHNVASLQEAREALIALNEPETK